MDSDQREAESRVGTTLLDKWHLDALIGIGGMASVFAGTHRNGLRGAVKILSEPFSREADIHARFLREGYIANRVDHPDAVRVLDDDTTSDGRAFLVMELLEGRALHVLAEGGGGRLDAGCVLFVADRVLDVLAAAHDKGIVHRDIKPENLFLTFEGHVKVLDFGIARMQEEKSPAPRATQSGSPMGTPAFMAPEQARGRWDLVGPQSDVWSLGATMFTLLAGEVVHNEETVAEILSAAFTKPARSIATAMPDLPKPIADLVDRALALEPAARWSGARAMQAAVREAYREIFGEALPKVAPPHRTSLLRSRSSVTPVTESIHDRRTRASHSRRSRTRRFLALAGVAVLALATVELRGSATEAAAAGPALASAGEDDLRATSRAPPMSRADDVMEGASLVAAAPSGTPSAPAPPLLSPAPSHRARRDLKALFDRRH
jgi:eukaryotic-like serine/threonine-protein kinase